MFDLYEISNWVELSTKSDQPRVSELLASNSYVKDYETLYNTFKLERSKFSQDPSKVGGEDCVAKMVGKTKIVFGGKVDWYPEDKGLGRAAGNRVGVQITPSLSLDEYPDVKVTIAGKVYDKSVFSDGDDNSIWYYPLITKDSKLFTVEIDWNGEDVEKFVIEITPGTYIKTKEETEKKSK